MMNGKGLMTIEAISWHLLGEKGENYGEPQSG
jgi:hypothetical protein